MSSVNRRELIMGAEKEEKADKYGKDAKKANKEIVEKRIERTIELISLCKPTGEILGIARQEWGGLHCISRELFAQSQSTDSRALEWPGPPRLHCHRPRADGSGGQAVDRDPADEQRHRCGEPSGTFAASN